MSENEWLPASHDAFPSTYRRRAESVNHETELREVQKQASTEASELASLSLRLIKTLHRIDPTVARAVVTTELNRLAPLVGKNEFPNLREVLDALAKIAGQ